jgi:hypothetical protein
VGGIIALVFLLFLIHNAPNLLVFAGYIAPSYERFPRSRHDHHSVAAAAAAVTAFLRAGSIGRFFEPDGKVILPCDHLVLLPFENKDAAYLFPLLGSGLRADRLVG